MSTTAAQQNAAAHRQLRDMGVGRVRIAELDAINERHIERGGVVPTPEPPPVAVGWCDEHDRYFYFDVIGCRGDRIPTAAEIRAYYTRGRSGRS